jgi:hypothetical protein
MYTLVAALASYTFFVNVVKNMAATRKKQAMHFFIHHPWFFMCFQEITTVYYCAANPEQFCSLAIFYYTSLMKNLDPDFVCLAILVQISFRWAGRILLNDCILCMWVVGCCSPIFVGSQCISEEVVVWFLSLITWWWWCVVCVCVSLCVCSRIVV